MRGLLLPFAVLLVACSTHEAEELPYEPLAPRAAREGDRAERPGGLDQASVPARGRVVPSDDQSTRPPWVTGGGGGGGGGDVEGGRFPERRGRPMMNEDEAAQAAREMASARAEADGPCAQAYAALASFSESFQEKAPWVPRRRPDRSGFMEGCLALPPAAQQCLVPSYRAGHEADCGPILGGTRL